MLLPHYHSPLPGWVLLQVTIKKTGKQNRNHLSTLSTSKARAGSARNSEFDRTRGSRGQDASQCERNVLAVLLLACLTVDMDNFASCRLRLRSTHARWPPVRPAARAACVSTWLGEHAWVWYHLPWYLRLGAAPRQARLC